MKKNIFWLLVITEWRCVVRNKRLKTIFFFIFYFVFFGVFLAIVADEKYDPLDLLLICISLSAITSGLGPFLFNKDGKFFDAIKCRFIPIEVYVSAKISFLFILSILLFLFILPFFYWMYNTYRWFVAASIIYATGINLFVMLYCASFDRKGIDYSRSAILNYRGISFSKQVAAIPIVAPLLFFQNYFDCVIILMFVSGLLSLVFIKVWIQLIVRNLSKRKYIILDGFRHLY